MQGAQPTLKSSSGCRPKYEKQCISLSHQANLSLGCTCRSAITSIKPFQRRSAWLRKRYCWNQSLLVRFLGWDILRILAVSTHGSFQGSHDQSRITVWIYSTSSSSAIIGCSDNWSVLDGNVFYSVSLSEPHPDFLFHKSRLRHGIPFRYSTRCTFFSFDARRGKSNHS